MAESHCDGLSQLLRENLSLEIINDGSKVKCKLSGHEMPCKIEAVESYIKGKKYRALKAKQDLDIESYMKHLEVSTVKGRERQLFCKLTCRHINNEPHHIYRHVQGKRFQKALKRWNECQKSGEEFKPRQSFLSKAEPSAVSEEEMDQSPSEGEELSDGLEENDDVVEDDLKDLYPSSDFESDASDNKMEHDESQGMDCEVDNKGIKRKEVEDHNPKKKLKVTKGSEKKKQNIIKQNKCVNST